MGSCRLVEKHHVHLGEQVRDHGRRSLARSGLLCLRSYLLFCACSLRIILLEDWCCEGGETQGGEQIDPGVQGQTQHCQTCSNHVNGHVTRKVVLA